MSKITVKTKMATVTFDNPQDAAEFVSMLEKPGGRTRRSTSRKKPEHPEQDAKTALKLLGVLLSVGDKGIMSDALAEEVGVKGPRGLSSFSTPTKKALERIGADYDSVVRIHRGLEGNRWFATAQTSAAIPLLKKELGLDPEGCTL